LYGGAVRTCICTDAGMTGSELGRKGVEKRRVSVI
jgi:hypothetical protein